MSQQRLIAVMGILALVGCGGGGQGNAGPTGGSPNNSRGGSGGGSPGAGGSGGTATPGTGGTAVNPGTGGTPSTGTGGAGASADAATTDANSDAGPSDKPPALAPGTCSSAGNGPMPVAGFAKADPVDTRFPFSTHFMGIFSDNPRCIGMTALGDIDNDGDEDFSSGQRDVACGGQANPGAPMLWWEYCGPDNWVRHVAGTGYKSAAGGATGDFDGDGWLDLVAGDSWFKNPGASVRTAGAWSRYATGAPGVTEELRVGDVTGDGKLDVLYVERSFRPQVRSPGPDPTQPWTLVTTLTTAQQQGGYIGDLDGDGRNDIVVGDRWWYRGAGGAGTAWAATNLGELPAFAPIGGNGSSPITAMADLDTDGDVDLLLQEHWGTKVAWLENADGRGTMWTGHIVAGTGGPFAAKTRGILHGLMAFDFDNDGDVDILSTENQGQIWIYENVDGKGMLAEHVIAMGGAHEPRVGDVDCDGDLDFVGVPWGDPNDGAAGRSETIRAHVYFKNELVERGGKALFSVSKGEVWNLPSQGRCRR